MSISPRRSRAARANYPQPSAVASSAATKMSADIAAGRVHSHEEVIGEMDELIAELERNGRGADAA